MKDKEYRTVMVSNFTEEQMTDYLEMVARFIDRGCPEEEAEEFASKQIMKESGYIFTDDEVVW